MTDICSAAKLNDQRLYNRQRQAPNAPGVGVPVRFGGVWVIAMAGLCYFGTDTRAIGLDLTPAFERNISGPLPEDSDKNQPTAEREMSPPDQQSKDLSGDQRTVLEARLKQSETSALLARQTAELATAQRNAQEAQFKQAEGKTVLSQLVQESGDLSPTERSALEAQLKQTEGRAQLAQIVAQSAELSPSERNLLEARIKQEEGRARLAQQNADLAAFQRKEMELQLREAEDQLERVKKVAESSVSKSAEEVDDSTKRESTGERGNLPAEQAKAGRALPLDAGQNARPAISTQPLLPPVNSVRH